MDPAYFEAIEAAFLSAAGRGLMLSPRDRQFIERWARAAIPEEVVVEAIRQTFEGRPLRRVRGLAFVAPAVEAAARAWRSRQVGLGQVGSDEVRAPVEEAGLGRLIGRVEADRSPASASAALRAEVRALALAALRRWAEQGCSGQALEVALAGLRTRLCEVVLSRSEPLVAHRLTSTVELSVQREAGWLSEEERAAARVERCWQAVRRHVGLPDLTLDGSSW